MVDATERNGVSTILRKELMEHALHICSTREFQVIVLRIGIHVVCIANAHLPDSHKRVRTGVQLEDVLDRLVLELDTVAQATPWHTLLLAGDCNAEFVPGGCIGNAANGSRVCDRSTLILEKLDRFLFTWSSTHVDDAAPYTHVHHRSKNRSVIDYVLASTPVGGKSCVTCKI
jgi:hypothetical protein